MEFLVDSGSLKCVTENRTTPAQIVIKIELFKFRELSDEQHGESEVMVDHSVRIRNIKVETPQLWHLGEKL